MEPLAVRSPAIEVGYWDHLSSGKELKLVHELDRYWLDIAGLTLTE